MLVIAFVECHLEMSMYVLNILHQTTDVYKETFEIYFMARQSKSNGDSIVYLNVRT